MRTPFPPTWMPSLAPPENADRWLVMPLGFEPPVPPVAICTLPAQPPFGLMSR